MKYKIFFSNRAELDAIMNQLQRLNVGVENKTADSVWTGEMSVQSLTRFQARHNVRVEAVSATPPMMVHLGRHAKKAGQPRERATFQRKAV